MTLPGRDVPWKTFLDTFKVEWKRDRVTNVAAALTFFGVLALFPFLLFLVALFGVVLKPDQVDQLVQELGRVAPGDVTRIVGGQIRDIQQGQNAGLLTLGILGALWSASGGMVSLIDGLNGIHDIEEDTRPFWKLRGIAILATLGAGFALLVSAVLAIAAAPIGEAIGGPVGTALVWLRLPVAGLAMMVVWAMLYWALPDVRQRKFHFITPGSVVGVLLWVAASWGFSFYVSHFGSYNKTYGAIGGVIVMLMWMWISAIVLLAGAEVNATLEQLAGAASGAKVERRAGATSGVTVERRAGTLDRRAWRIDRRARAAASAESKPGPAGRARGGEKGTAGKLALGAGLLLLLRRHERHT